METQWGVIRSHYRTEKGQISICWTIIKMIFNHSLIIDPIALEFRFRQPTSA